VFLLLRRRIVLATVVVLGLAYGLSHVERYENSFIYVTKDRAYDPLGISRDIYNQLSRDCSSVVTLSPQTEDWKAIQNLLSHLSEPKETPATPLTIMREGNWFLVESDFVQLEPAIFLIEKRNQGLAVSKDAIWSGTPGPWTPGPEIRKLMQAKSPQTPSSLIRCFKPTLAHFSS
jgi:hypothetical protein